MTRISSCIFLAMSVLSCNSQKTYNFVGRVFDGSTGKQITTYTISMLYDADSTVKGTVDKTGRYSLEGLPAMQDFTVTITATGYRAFDSTNRGLNAAGLSAGVVNAQGQSESLYFDAYLFPTSLAVPATTLDVVVADVGGANGQEAESAVSGTLHLTPGGPSALLNVNADPGAIGGAQAQLVSSSYAGQVWGNTDDIELASLDVPVTAGVASVAANTLIYGVNYNIDFYGDAEHAFSVNAGAGFTAGKQLTATIVLQPLTGTGLLVLSTDANGITGVSNNAVQDGVLRIVFNQAVEFDPTYAVNNTLTAAQLGALYSGIGGVGGVQVAPADAAADGNGLVVAISGNELSITVPTADITMPTPIAPTLGLSYGNGAGTLSALIVRPVVKTNAASYTGTPLTAVQTSGGGTLGLAPLTVSIVLP